MPRSFRTVYQLINRSPGSVLTENISSRRSKPQVLRAMFIWLAVGDFFLADPGVLPSCSVYLDLNSDGCQRSLRVFIHRTDRRGAIYGQNYREYNTIITTTQRHKNSEYAVRSDNKQTARRHNPKTEYTAESTAISYDIQYEVLRLCKTSANLITSQRY